jgi:hypothetical protein
MFEGLLRLPLDVKFHSTWILAPFLISVKMKHWVISYVVSDGLPVDPVSFLGGELANIILNKYGSIDYEWGISSASTDFVGHILYSKQYSLIYFSG